MGVVDDVAQKVKGKAQQVRGEIKKKSGHKTDGLVDQVKGKVNETIADVKLKAREEQAKNDK